MKTFITLFTILLLLVVVPQAKSQVLYSESFNSLSLTTATYVAGSNIQTYAYNDVPANMATINDGNLVADTLTGNYPFRANGQKQKAWLAYQAPNQTDTFAVSTSWLNPIGDASAWLITPLINNIAVNTVLSWESIAPDATNPDGFEVYVSTVNTATPSVSDFQILIYSTLSELSTWQKHGISLSAFAGQSIRIAFRNMSSNKYQLWLDDINVENIANAYDAESVSHHIYKYSTINTNNVITAVFKNNAYIPITNLVINYQMNNGSIVSETKILSPALDYLESRELSFSLPYNSSTALFNNFKIWTGNINNQLDQNHANDTIYGTLSLASYSPVKNVLVEQIASARDAWSPDDYVKLKDVVDTITNVIAVSHHQSDNLASATASNLIGNYNITNNHNLIDRYYFTDQNKLSVATPDLSSLVAQRLLMKVPATVTVTNVSYDSITRQINATVSTTFAADVKGTYLLNLYVKENNVYGPKADSSDNGWNQYNAFYNNPASVYYQYGNYNSAIDEYIMSAVSYQQQFVADTLLSGVFGESAGIPTLGSTLGQTYTHNYTYTLPTPLFGEFRYNADNIYLIGTLSEYDTNNQQQAVLNCAEVKLTSKPETMVGVRETKNILTQLNLYPNPTTNFCYLDFYLDNNELITINVYNTLGELVYIESQQHSSGQVKHALNTSHLPTGNYSISVVLRNSVVTKKLTVIR